MGGCLEGLGHEVIVADPNFAPMYATRHRKIKTDRRDARALAEACVLGAYRPAHRVSDGQRHVRGRLGVRDALVRTRTRYIALIRARLRQDGWRVPTGSAEGFSRRVLALPLPGRLRSEAAPLLAVMRQVNHQIEYSDERIAALTATDARVRRLQSVPSIGPVTAAAFVAALDDAQRFWRAHQVEAYLGLVPREWSSGETPRRGRITKAGAGRVRWLLIQAAVSMLRLRDAHTAELRDWAERIASRRGKKIAVVALARRLAGILFALLRDETVYKPQVSQPAIAGTIVPARPGPGGRTARHGEGVSGETCVAEERPGGRPGRGATASSSGRHQGTPAAPPA